MQIQSVFLSVNPEGKMATLYTNFATQIEGMAIESDHFQTDSKPYNKRIDVFAKQ